MKDVRQLRLTRYTPLSPNQMYSIENACIKLINVRCEYYEFQLKQKTREMNECAAGCW